MLAEVGGGPLGRGGEGDPLDRVPAGLFAELERHGLRGFIVRLLAIIKRGEDLLYVVIGEALGGEREDVRDLHGRLRDGAGLVHAENVHMGESLNAVHVLHQHAATRQLQAADRDGNAGQKVQSLRDHADQRGDGGFYGFAQGKPLKYIEVVPKEEHDAQWNERDADDGNQTRQGFHHL